MFGVESVHSSTKQKKLGVTGILMTTQPIPANNMGKGVYMVVSGRELSPAVHHIQVGAPKTMLPPVPPLVPNHRERRIALFPCIHETVGEQIIADHVESCCQV